MVHHLGLVFLLPFGATFSFGFGLLIYDTLTEINGVHVNGVEIRLSQDPQLCQ